MKAELLCLVLIVGLCYSQITLPLNGTVIVYSTYDYNQSNYHQTFVYNVTDQGFQNIQIKILALKHYNSSNNESCRIEPSLNFGTSNVTLQSVQGGLEASTYIFPSTAANAISVSVYAEDNDLESTGFAIQACPGTCPALCNSDCSGRGFCQPATLTCMCNDGYDGDGCEICLNCPSTTTGSQPSHEGFLGTLIGGSIGLTIFLILVLPIVVFVIAIAIVAYFVIRRRLQQSYVKCIAFELEFSLEME